eukprot:TRINITY_DN7482_c0_g1_i2.p1 TRINITY_DN7482_c0_g1~~TRINITY_DN7482_c0_g1_i2.p1  ORF type:complete len:165 (-),score=37.40 TRINITY_DN7482_c0_g1_i2:476-970(-)
MFRASSEEELQNACEVAAELQMMVDEGEPLDLQGVTPLACLSLVISFLWSLPWPLLPSSRLLDTVAAETPERGMITAEDLAVAWGEVRSDREGIRENEDQVVLQLLHQVLAPVKALKAISTDDALDLALALAPAIFQLDTRGSVIHSLRLSHAQVAVFVLAELV